jgi:dTDP-4-dehydrorhamnose reductase
MTPQRTRVLVLGGTGMLGHKLVHALEKEPDLDVFCTVRTLPAPAFRAGGVTYVDGVALDRSSSRLAAVLRDVSPRVVINAVGAIKQKDLSGRVDETFFLNGTIPHLVPILSGDPDLRVVHISTDCVFRGDRGDYVEADAPDALDLYGRSKAVGEMDYGHHLTLRTSIIGFETGGFLGLVSWLFRQPRGSVLHGYRRALYSGLPTVELSRDILAQIRAERPLTGLYHVASEPIAKYDLLLALNRAFDLGHEILPEDTFQMNRVLDDSRYRKDTGRPRPEWPELIAALVQDFESLPYGDLYFTAAR